MTAALWVAASYCGFASILHFASVVVAVVRSRPRQRRRAADAAMPPVTIVRPVCGIDNFMDETLRSSFELDYPHYEVLFCVASAKDPIVPVVNKVMGEYPSLPARLLVGDERVSTNPKLNNCVKGWNAAAHGWIVLADSNVLMPPDYLQRLLGTWRHDSGLVCSPPVGTRPHGFWARLECAFLNTHQARWQYFADTLGLGFAQGKTMLWRRDILEAAGGIRALGQEIAEDAASTKVVRGAGLSVHLVDGPFAQPLGRRNAMEVWHRQTRWARLRRACFPHLFLPEILTGALLPTLSLAFVATATGWPIAASVTAFVAVWYALEIALTLAARWPFSLLYPLHAALRDLLLPFLWLDGLIGGDFEWRGNAMSVEGETADERTAEI